jgi:uncharacterized protein YjiS (DUF1127 family)
MEGLFVFCALQNFAARRQSRKAKPVTLSLLANLKSHWKDNETARQIAQLTDRELADIGAEQIGGRILSKAQNYRVADGLRRTPSPLRYVSFPSA